MKSFYRLGWLVLIFFGTISLHAQTPLTVLWTPTASLPQLVINHAGGEETQVSLHLRYQAGGQTLQSWHSRPITLKPGGNRIPLEEIGDFSAIERFQQREFPGPVELCLRILPIPHGDVVYDDCHVLQQAPAQPPHLVYPFDREDLETQLPVFSWTPPAPLKPGQMLSYSLRMVEVLPYQTATAALIGSPAFLFREDLNQNVMPYSLSYQALQVDQRYAWQIEAFSNGISLGKSEVWTFTIRKPGEDAQSEPDPDYVELRRKLNSGYYPAKGRVCFRFDAHYGEIMPNIEVYNQQNEQISVPDSRLERTGTNLFILHLPPGSGFREGDYYVIKVANAKGEVNQMRFRYLYPE